MEDYELEVPWKTWDHVPYDDCGPSWNGSSSNDSSYRGGGSLHDPLLVYKIIYWNYKFITFCIYMHIETYYISISKISDEPII